MHTAVFSLLVSFTSIFFGFLLFFFFSLSLFFSTTFSSSAADAAVYTPFFSFCLLLLPLPPLLLFFHSRITFDHLRLASSRGDVYESRIQELESLLSAAEGKSERLQQENRDLVEENAALKEREERYGLKFAKGLVGLDGARVLSATLATLDSQIGAFKFILGVDQLKRSVVEQKRRAKGGALKVNEYDEVIAKRESENFAEGVNESEGAKGELEDAYDHLSRLLVGDECMEVGFDLRLQRQRKNRRLRKIRLLFTKRMPKGKKKEALLESSLHSYLILPTLVVLRSAFLSSIDAIALSFSLVTVTPVQRPIPTDGAFSFL